MWIVPPLQPGSPAPRGIIFDFDGVIVDTEGAVYQAWREVFLAHGADLPLDLYSRCVGSDHGTWDPKSYLETITGLKPDWPQILEEKNRRTRELLAGMEPMPGIRETLEFLSHQPVALAVASSSSRTWVGGWLDRLQLAKFFHCWHGRDDVQHVKPSPELFLLAARSLRLHPSHILVIEDSANGLRAAQTAGMQTLIVPNEITRWQEFEG